MRLEDYTPRKILGAMGLATLAPAAPVPGWSARILLMPSFDPELAMSFVAQDTPRVRLEVRVLASQLWLESHVSAPRPFVSASAEVPLSLVGGLGDVVLRSTAYTGMLTLDGMRYAIFLQDRNGAFERRGNVSADADVKTLLRELLPAVVSAVTDQTCIRVLTGAARYLSLGATASPELRQVGPIEVTHAPQRAKTFVVLAADYCCPQCSVRGRRFRRLTDCLICQACGRSFTVDALSMRGATEEVESVRDTGG